LAAEAGEFEISDVIRSISTKLIQRHPHVFGSLKVKDAGEVLINWEALKRKERGSETSILANVPKQLPALSYSQDIQSRVARVGFDWEDIEGVIAKLVEEVNEFKQADSQEKKAREFGDLLFTLVNIARRLGVDSESVLREANRRFYRRFSYMEEVCRKRGVNFGDLSFDEQNALFLAIGCGDGDNIVPASAGCHPGNSGALPGDISFSRYPLIAKFIPIRVRSNTLNSGAITLGNYRWLSGQTRNNWGFIRLNTATAKYCT